MPTLNLFLRQSAKIIIVAGLVLFFGGISGKFLVETDCVASSVVEGTINPVVIGGAEVSEIEQQLDLLLSNLELLHDVYREQPGNQNLAIALREGLTQILKNLRLDVKETSNQELDTDGDGLKDFEEIEWGTDRNLVDTDNDGVSDKQEVDQGSSPLDESDGGIAPLNVAPVSFGIFYDHNTPSNVIRMTVEGYISIEASDKNKIVRRKIMVSNEKPIRIFIDYYATIPGVTTFDYVTEIGLVGLSAEDQIIDPDNILRGENLADGETTGKFATYVLGSCKGELVGKSALRLGEKATYNLQCINNQPLSSVALCQQSMFMEDISLPSFLTLINKNETSITVQVNDSARVGDSGSMKGLTTCPFGQEQLSSGNVYVKEDECENLKEELQKKQDSLESFYKYLEELEKKRLEIGDDIGTKEDEIFEKEKEIANKLETGKNIADNLKLKQAELSETEQSLSLKEKELGDYNLQLIVKEGRLENEKEDLAVAKKNKSDCEKLVQDKIDQFNFQKSVVNLLAGRLTDLRELEAKQESNLGQAKQALLACQNTSNDCSELETNIQTLQSEFDETANLIISFENELAKEKELLEKLESEMKQQEATCTEFSKEIALIEETIVEISQKIQEIKLTILTLAEEIKNLQEKIMFLERLIQNLEDEGRLTDDEIYLLNVDIGVLRSEINENLFNLTEIEEQIQFVQAQIESIEIEIADLEKQISEECN